MKSDGADINDVPAFEKILYGIGFERNSHTTSKEMVYDLQFNTWLIIRVYSGIPKFVSSIYQKKTIRIKIVERLTDKFLYGREIDVAKWKTIKSKIQRVVMDAKRFRRCGCGGILVVKPGVRGKFLGCTRFPMCKVREELPIL